MKLERMLGACAFAVALRVLSPVQAHAVVTEEELAQIRQSIKQLEQQHAEDAKRIKEMEQRLKASEARALASQSPAGETPMVPLPAKSDLQSTSANISSPTLGSASTKTGAPASAGAFNPAIGVTLMGTYANFKHNPDKASIPGFALGGEAGSLGTQGFSLGESEVSLSANIDQALYGQLILSLAPEGGVEVEEGFIQSTSLPLGFTVKGGRFFSGIGYLNEQHKHAWDFLDAPLPYRAMLGNQLGDDGVQIRWTAPTAMFLQFGVEGLRGDTFPATSTHDGVGAQSIFVKAGGDVGVSNSWLASLAYYHADAKDRETVTETAPDLFTGTSDLGIAGLVWKWAPNGNPVQRNLKLQSEFFFRHEDGTYNDLAYNGDQTGFYGQAVYQFMPRWSIGARYDQVSARGGSADFTGTTLDNLDHTPRRYSSVLMYDTSEFGRFRLQYNIDDSGLETNQGVLLNYTVSFGAHGAHQY